MFYTFNQNNSGGNFVIDHDRGISIYVVVECDSHDEANSVGESIGLYFGGGGDCHCCGDRWSRAWDDLDEVPSVYGEPVEGRVVKGFNIDWAIGENEVYVHYKDGRVVGYKNPKHYTSN